MTDSQDAPVFPLKDVMAKFGKQLDGSRKTRKARQKAVMKAADGRSARATGRTEQFNFRSVPGLKARAQATAAQQGMTLSAWMEIAVEAALASE